MLTAINTILEMAATLICVNYLFGKRYYFSIYDAVFMVVEVTLIESANYFGLSIMAQLSRQKFDVFIMN